MTEISIAANLIMPEEVAQMVAPLEFAKYAEVYDLDLEDTKEKLVNFILLQAETYKKELTADVSDFNSASLVTLHS